MELLHLPRKIKFLTVKSLPVLEASKDPVAKDMATEEGEEMPLHQKSRELFRVRVGEAPQR